VVTAVTNSVSLYSFKNMLSICLCWGAGGMCVRKDPCEAATDQNKFPAKVSSKPKM